MRISCVMWLSKKVPCFQTVDCFSSRVRTLKSYKDLASINLGTKTRICELNRTIYCNFINLFFIKLEKLTIIIPTFNEEDFIEEAIETASFADEIIVIDSYSTDKTSELVKKHNVVFIQHRFENFSNQRYFAAKHATNDMILFVDADERIPKLLREEIQNILKSGSLNSGYEIFISVIFMGRHMRHGCFKNNWKLRLFNKKFCWYDESLLVHEKNYYKRRRKK